MPQALSSYAFLFAQLMKTLKFEELATLVFLKDTTKATDLFTAFQSTLKPLVNN
jgi:hypothetical protein